MKTKFSLVVSMCIVFISLTIHAQNVDYNKIILPDNATNISFEERLVQLAWKNNPSSRIVQNDVLIAQYEMKERGAKWSTLVGVNGNLNEFNLNNSATDGDGNQFFPRYNVFLNLPLSIFVEAPQQKKAAKARVESALQSVDLAKLELRSTVLKIYSDYKKFELIWNIRKQSMADEESNYLLMEQKFKNGESPIDDYIRAQKSRNDQKIQLALAETDFIKAKLDLEAIIGVKLEEVK